MLLVGLKFGASSVFFGFVRFVYGFLLGVLVETFLVCFLMLVGDGPMCFVNLFIQSVLVVRSQIVSFLFIRVRPRTVILFLGYR